MHDTTSPMARKEHPGDERSGTRRPRHLVDTAHDIGPVHDEHLLRALSLPRPACTRTALPARPLAKGR